MFDTCWAPRWRASRRLQQGAKARRPPRRLRRTPSSLPLVDPHRPLECVIHCIVRQHRGAEGRALSSVIGEAGLPLMRGEFVASLERIATDAAVCARGTWGLFLVDRFDVFAHGAVCFARSSFSISTAMERQIESQRSSLV